MASSWDERASEYRNFRFFLCKIVPKKRSGKRCARIEESNRWSDNFRRWWNGEQMWPGCGYMRVQEHRWLYTRNSTTIWCCVCAKRLGITCFFSFTLPILTHFALSRLLCMQPPLLLMIFTVHTDLRSLKGKRAGVGNRVRTYWERKLGRTRKRAGV